MRGCGLIGAASAALFIVTDAGGRVPLHQMPTLWHRAKHARCATHLLSTRAWTPGCGPGPGEGSGWWLDRADLSAPTTSVDRGKVRASPAAAKGWQGKDWAIAFETRRAAPGRKPGALASRWTKQNASEARREQGRLKLAGGRRSSSSDSYRCGRGEGAVMSEMIAFHVDKVSRSATSWNGTQEVGTRLRACWMLVVSASGRACATCGARTVHRPGCTVRARPPTGTPTEVNIAAPVFPCLSVVSPAGVGALHCPARPFRHCVGQRRLPLVQGRAVPVARP